MKNRSVDLYTTVLSRVLKKIHLAKSQLMAQYDLKNTTATCLCELWNAPEGLIASELSQLCEMDKAQVSRCIAELVEKGFVYRDSREGQCYRQRHFLTESGKQIANKIVKETEEAKNRMLQGLTAEQVESFCRVIDVIEANVEDFLEV